MTALGCGAMIGSERQVRSAWRAADQRAGGAGGGGLRDLLGAWFRTRSRPTRVAAQVVSGIGFLGAGIIFRDGFNVHGLNTAATLWCSAGWG
jgi:putative Mg2+ transporter-C (MgtC) family protein